MRRARHSLVELYFKTRWLLHRSEMTYLFHVCLSHVNVSIHLLKVLLCSVGLFAVPLKFSFTLKTVRYSRQVELLISLIMDVITCTYTSYRFKAQHCVQQRSFYVTETAMGAVEVCRPPIKQMFIVVICVEKNNHSSNPLLTPLTEQLVFVRRACTLNYLPRSQWDH